MYHPIKKKWITKDSITDPYCNLSLIKTDYDNKPLKSAAGYVIRITPYKKYYNSMKDDFSRSQYAYKQFSVYTLPSAVNITKLTSPAKGTISVTYGKSPQ